MKSATAYTALMSLNAAWSALRAGDRDLAARRATRYRLIAPLARHASVAMQPFVPSQSQHDGRTALLDYEPSEVASAVSQHKSFREAVEAVAANSDLDEIAPMSDLGPVLLAATGEPRISAIELVGVCIAAAAVELRCLGLKPDADKLAEMSLRNVERLQRIARRVLEEIADTAGQSAREVSG